MVKCLIARANKVIAELNKKGANIEKILHWTPYQLRHTTTADAMESILKLAMERLGHTDTKMTENYSLTGKKHFRYC